MVVVAGVTPLCCAFQRESCCYSACFIRIVKKLVLQILCAAKRQSVYGNTWKQMICLNITMPAELQSQIDRIQIIDDTCLHSIVVL